MKNIPVIQATRQTFKRDVIDPLDKEDFFEIHTQMGRFRMTKNDFYTHFPKVPESISYKRDGHYNYPTMPRRTRTFRVDRISESMVQHSLYTLPAFLSGLIDSKAYKRWLQRKAQAHVIRDKKRWGGFPNVSNYKKAIHRAVEASRGRDFYTGEILSWAQISRFNNEEAKKGGRNYKKKFWNLPTVDHVNQSTRHPEFRICSWIINDCKSDLTHEEFLEVCGKVLKNGAIR